MMHQKVRSTQYRATLEVVSRGRGKPAQNAELYRRHDISISGARDPLPLCVRRVLTATVKTKAAKIPATNRVTSSICHTLRDSKSHPALTTRCAVQFQCATLELLVTFKRTSFDLLVLLATIQGLPLDHPHIDLCLLGRQISYCGGLKAIEL